MPIPLPKPSPAKRKSGWLLRESYKEDMKRERELTRERMNNSKFNPLKSAKYNLKRAVYRSVNIPDISKVLEQYVHEGYLSKVFAKSIIQDLVFTNKTSLVRNSSKEELIAISKKPKKGIETDHHKVAIVSEHKIDPLTRNIVKIIRTTDGKVTVIVAPGKI